MANTWFVSMFVLKVFPKTSMMLSYFLLSVSDATVLLNVNTTAGEPIILPCGLITRTAIDLKLLRFYWQDERKHVWYSFNKGKEMPQHVNNLYRDRITAFQQDMTTGNISVEIKNATLEDNQRVLQAFAAVFDDKETWKYRLGPDEICKMILHVSVPYKKVSVAVNKESNAAVCSAQGGFPEPLVKWSVQFLSDNTQHFLDPGDVHTTVVQDPHNHLYNLSSTVKIPGDISQYQSVICLLYNPTLNVTISDSYVLSKGEAARSVSALASCLVAAVVLLVSAQQ